jgi:crotonobetainyl-CoA:carnitine CoA-transferase CaiB-like acyl-CoA transferase
VASFRVADFSTHFPGPMTSHLLSELGGDVVKFENSRHGDGNRSLIPHVDGVSVFHAMLSSGMRSVALDRRSDSWDQIVAAAARWADVVVVGGTAADLKSRGLDFETIQAANPTVVYCALPAYGNIGPWKNLPGHGQNMDAYAGAVIVEADADGRPETPASWRGPGTTIAPLFAALGVMRALFERTRDGAAKYVEVSVWGAAVWYSWRDVICQANVGRPWHGVHDLGSRYALYRTADDRVLLVCPIEKKFWESFCEITGLPSEMKGRGDWGSGGMDFGKGPAYGDERDGIQSRLGTQPLDQWVTRLGAAGVPIAPILTLAEVLGSDHAAAQEVLATVEPAEAGGRELRVPRMPIRVGPPEPERRAHPPRLGQHTSEFLEELGLSSPPPVEAGS